MGGKYPLSGCSLEYRFIDVQDEETDGEESEEWRESSCDWCVNHMNSVCLLFNLLGPIQFIPQARRLAHEGVLALALCRACIN